MNKKILLLIALFVSCSKPEPAVVIMEQPVVFEAEFLTKNLSDSRISFNNSGTEVFFSAPLSENSQVNLDIWYSVKNNGVWQEPVSLPCNSAGDDYSPWLAPDETVLYFISKREGGIGNADIWWVEKTEEGWSDPVNLGTPINTPGDEEDVFINSDGRYVLFSSDGRNGSGMKDIYYSENWGGYWAPPESFGRIINSQHNEFYPWINSNGTFLIFASTRDDTTNNTSNLWYSYKTMYGWDIMPKPITDVNTEMNEYAPLLINSTLYFSRGGEDRKGAIWSVKVQLENMDLIKIIDLPKNELR